MVGMKKARLWSGLGDKKRSQFNQAPISQLAASQGATVAKRPLLKSSMAWAISAWEFMTKGP